MKLCAVIKCLYNIWALRFSSVVMAGRLCGGLMTHAEVVGQGAAKVTV